MYNWVDSVGCASRDTLCVTWACPTNHDQTYSERSTTKEAMTWLLTCHGTLKLPFVKIRHQLDIGRLPKF